VVFELQLVSEETRFKIFCQTCFCFTFFVLSLWSLVFGVDSLFLCIDLLVFLGLCLVGGKMKAELEEKGREKEHCRGKNVPQLIVYIKFIWVKFVVLCCS
jgi:hypothetical protein